VQKLSKAEAGKLGAVKSKVTCALNKQKREETYYKQPNTCKQCSSILPYEGRSKTFCCSSCAATHNNLKRDSRETSLTWHCLHCNKEHTTKRYRLGQYCNTKCQQSHAHQARVNDWLNNNANVGKGTIKRYLAETYGSKCSCCNISEWNGKAIVFDLEHIDGDSTNNTLNNVCLICPNCHSQTDTFKGKNRGNGRHARRVRYAEGKSF
jgi:hypothetical protein